MMLGVATKHRLELLAIVAVVLLASIFPVDLSPSAPHRSPGRDGQYSGKQGDVLLVTVPPVALWQPSPTSVPVTGVTKSQHLWLLPPPPLMPM